MYMSNIYDFIGLVAKNLKHYWVVLLYGKELFIPYLSRVTLKSLYDMHLISCSHNVIYSTYTYSYVDSDSG